MGSRHIATVLTGYRECHHAVSRDQVAQRGDRRVVHDGKHGLTTSHMVHSRRYGDVRCWRKEDVGQIPMSVKCLPIAAVPRAPDYAMAARFRHASTFRQT